MIVWGRHVFLPATLIGMRRYFLLAGAVALLTAAGPDRTELAERVSAGWADKPRLAARLLMSRYGPPDEVGAHRLIWHGNGPWKRTIVRNVLWPYSDAAGEELGVVEQSVAYDLTPEKAAALAPFSRRLAFDPARMEMSSRADREETNFLRLNLADDVLKGRITAAEAQDSYARTVELEAAGKTTRYLRGLTFGPGRVKTP